ncbi:MAG: isochorismatase family protein [Bacteroidales bacterium]|nr:isochorismatase family protein [Bacteroidales bacterium]
MRILKDNTAAIIIDIQERLFPHMHDSEKLLQNCQKLIDGLQVLSVPMLVTQQYTRGLGQTHPLISIRFLDFSFFEKIAFSCFDEPSVKEQLNSLNRKFIVLFGIETHVCVLQTCVDLIENGYMPVVVEDCVSSRNLCDKETAIGRMRQEGALITTFESLLFELTRTAGNEVFKRISGIVK